MDSRVTPVEQKQAPTETAVQYGGRGGGHAALTSRMFESLRNPVYRLYWGGMMGQMGAMNMQMVARSWFMYELTGSAALLGATALANGVPMLLFSLYGGVIADRVHKKHVLMAGQTASALLSLVIALLISVGFITWSYLLIAAVIQGLIMALMMPSRQALIPELVGEEGLTNAIALNTAGMNINRLLAPAFGGLLIALVGIEAVYYVMTGLYIVAILFISALPRTGTMAIQGGGALADVVEGLRYIKESTVLPGLLIMTLLGVLFSMPYMMLLPLFTTDILIVNPASLEWVTSIPVIGRVLTPFPELFGESSFRLGALMTISGIGALVGSLVIAAVGDRKRGLLYLFSMTITGVGLVAFSATTWYFLALLFIIPVGFGQAGRMALGNVLVQANTEDVYRGRVMSVYMMEFGLNSFSVFAVALVAGAIGVQWAIGGSAVLLLLLNAYYFLFAPQIRKLN